MRKRLWFVVVGMLVAGSVAAFPAAAGASGPGLDVPISTLASAIACHGDLASAGPAPVLLVPGTTLTPQVNFSWNYEKVFTAEGRPWCAVTIPGHGMGDIQVAAEYVVYAIRTMAARAGRRVSILGYSQGGMSPRWALKWWPDTRALVDDLVSIDGSNHGTLDTVRCACCPASRRCGSRTTDPGSSLRSMRGRRPTPASRTRSCTRTSTRSWCRTSVRPPVPSCTPGPA
jgi:hypothetical protein